jgi:Type II secretion system (T2SS), protein G
MSEVARYSSVRRPNSVRKIITVLVVTTLALGALPAAALLISLSLMRTYGKNDLENDLAKTGAELLTLSVRSYQLKYDAFPTRLEELVHPPDGSPFVEPGVLLDPWGRPYQYDPAGPRHNGRQPDIWTVTPKGEVIGNWP